MLDVIIPARLRSALKAAIRRRSTDAAKASWVRENVYSNLVAAAFNNTLPSEVRADVVDMLTLVYATLPEEERLKLRKQAFDQFFAPDLDRSLLDSLSNLILRAKELHPDKAGALKSIQDKLLDNDPTVRSRAEGLLGYFLYNMPL